MLTEEQLHTLERLQAFQTILSAYRELKRDYNLSVSDAGKDLNAENCALRNALNYYAYGGGNDSSVAKRALGIE